MKFYLPAPLMRIFTSLCKCPPHIFSGLGAAISLASLLSAFTAQYVFHLLPCDLCLFQRIPFAINILLGMAAYFIPQRATLLTTLMGFSFWVNSGIALFHSGVERKWWIWNSGCTTPDMSGPIEDVISRINATAVVRCDEIPWSLFGLSMANYNVMLCFGLGAICLAYVYQTVCTAQTSNKNQW